jgi:hypothetical protein
MKGSNSEKLTMLAIAMCYFVRSFLTFAYKLFTVERNCYAYFNPDVIKDNPLLREEIEIEQKLELVTTDLNVYGQVDDFMNVGYEGLLFLLNLWLVFVSNNVQNMIFNALVVEFIMKVDDEYKEYYFKTNASAITVILKKGRHIPKGDAQVSNFKLSVVASVVCVFTGPLNGLSYFSVPFLCMVMCVYGPICK